MGRATKGHRRTRRVFDARSDPCRAIGRRCGWRRARDLVERFGHRQVLLQGGQFLAGEGAQGGVPALAGLFREERDGVVVVVDHGAGEGAIEGRGVQSAQVVLQLLGALHGHRRGFMRGAALRGDIGQLVVHARVVVDDPLRQLAHGWRLRFFQREPPHRDLEAVVARCPGDEILIAARQYRLAGNRFQRGGAGGWCAHRGRGRRARRGGRGLIAAATGHGQRQAGGAGSAKGKTFHANLQAWGGAVGDRTADTVGQRGTRWRTALVKTVAACAPGCGFFTRDPRGVHRPLAILGPLLRAGDDHGNGLGG